MKINRKILLCVGLVTILCMNSIKAYAQQVSVDDNAQVESIEKVDYPKQEEDDKKESLKDGTRTIGVNGQDKNCQTGNIEYNIQEKQDTPVHEENIVKQYKTNTENIQENQIVIEDGKYRIKSEKNHNRYVGIENCSNNNEARIVLQNYTNELNIIFEIKHCDDGFYTVKAMNSSKVIDVPGASNKMETKLHQYEFNGTDAQKWKIQKNNNGTYSLMAKCNNYYWDLPGASTEIGIGIQMYEGNETVAQQFVFEKVINEEGTKTIENGKYRIRLAGNSGKYVGIENGSSQNEAKVDVKNYSGGMDLIFDIKYLEDGYYEIQSEKSKKSIDVPGASRSLETKIQQYSSNNTDAQRWIIREVTENTYTVISKCNNLCWDLPGGRVSNGTQIQMYSMNGTVAQQFVFEKYTQEESTRTIEDGEYRISLAYNREKYLGIEDETIENEAKVVVKDYTNELDTIFNVKYLDDGYYMIQCAKSKKSIDVPGASGILETKIQQYNSNATDAQKWIIREVAENRYTVISKCNNLCWDLPGGRANNGTKIQMYSLNGTLAQQFIFEKVIHEKGERTVEDGMYIIRSAKDKTKVLGINNGKKENSMPIVLVNDTDANCQKFNIKYTDDGYYTINLVHSEKALDVPGASLKMEQKIQQYDKNSTDAQKWIIKDLGNGKYSFISKCSELYADLCSGSTNIGTALQTYRENGTLAQQFLLEKTSKRAIDEGTYQIETKVKSNMVLDISGGSISNNANLQIWSNDNVNQQKFRISYLKDGYYKIEALHSSKVLTLDSSEKNVVQYEWNGSISQQWMIIEVGKDKFSIISRKNGLYLDVAGANSANGTNVGVYESNKTNAQIFGINVPTKSKLKGIDVSNHQGVIDWNAVKNSGIDFAILRCGYGENIPEQDDFYFIRNMNECERLGIDYGVYLYSYALNENGAVSEADHVLRLIQGHRVPLGVWFDMEDADGYKQRHGMPSDETLVNICKTFCDRIKNKGYDVGIYASYYWLTAILNSSKLDSYDKWVAQWSSRCSYTKPYKMWQYTSTGTVDGIHGNVDMNYLYK